MRRAAWLLWAVLGCSGSGPGRVCVPRAQQDCSCEGGTAGFQACLADGSGFGACECPGGGGGPDTPFVRPAVHNAVLGRPTDTSIAVSVLASGPGDRAWVEYGTARDASGEALVAPAVSATVTSSGGEPLVVELSGLSPGTRYYYRLHVAPGGAGDVPDNLHTFHTARAKGATFHFGVQGDTHPERYQDKMFHPELFTRTVEQVRERQPDLYFMLGDDFSSEKIIQDFKAANFGAGYKFTRAVEGSAPPSAYAALSAPFQRAMLVDGVGAPKGYAAYRELREKYLGLMAHSTPLMLVNGNHEQAHAANLGGLFNNASVWAAEGRLKYYPLPAPDGFYSGDAQPMTSVNGYPTLDVPGGLLRDFYAFTWGDALFVTIDPYWHSPLQSPDSSLFNGDKEEPWKSTLGDAQYAWLKQTLESSKAKWKFVFAHHVNGNNRGAAAIVGREEWGGTVAEFQAKRPGWAKPIHQLMADTGVTIFFQGHDHLYAREKVDGVVYQEVPNPGDNSYFAYNCDAYAPGSVSWPGAPGYGAYDAAWSVRMPNTGFLDVEVSPEKVTVSYVRTYREVDLQKNANKVFSGKEVNGEVAFRYSLPAQPGDSAAQDFAYSCLGAAPPAGWIYNP